LEDILNISDDAQAEVERIRKRIIDLCETNLAHGPYLLSRLGGDLGQDVHLLRSVTGAKLTQFLEDSLSDRYKLVPTVRHPHIKAIVRLNDNIVADFVGSEATTLAEPRFHYRFWAAFSVPAKFAGTFRYLSPTELIFRDQESADDAPEGWLLVENEFIAPTEIPARDSAIKINIEKWLAKHGYEKTRFLHGNFKSKAVSRNVLSAMIDALGPQQLKSTTMSLDVIATLLTKRI
jgi:hypothetical protein